MSGVKIAPSILSANAGKLAEEIESLEKCGADVLHLDIMDGNFVPNITFGPWIVKLAKKASRLPADAHLMVEDPLYWAPVFAEAGADMISVHQEAARHLHKVLSSIREHGAKAGLALNPGTPVHAAEPVLPYLDFILVMGVNPGFSGQPYIPETLAKVKKLSDMLKQTGFEGKISIEVDGGVNDRNIKGLADAGAEIMVTGSFLFDRGPEHYAGNIELLKGQF